jgi:TolA-binding protein
VFLVLALVTASAPAFAQDSDPARTDKRLGKLESELRAVQRKVFPGGDPRYFEAEIAAPAAPLPTPAGSPASQPLIDLSERVGEMERQLRTLTGQVEAIQFSQRQQQDAQIRMKGDFEFRLAALEKAMAPPPAVEPVDPAPKPETTAPGKEGGKEVAKNEGGKNIAKPPATVDASWNAAYAKVTAKDWPGAEVAMTDFVARFPKARRAGEAQYWLGRSFAARKQVAAAAKAFFDGYQAYPGSDRAADGLIGLAGAMNELKKPDQACGVLGVLTANYGDKLTGGQKAEAKTLRSKAKCEA